MVIYIDENLPPQLAAGLNIIQEPLNQRNRTNFQVKSIKATFGEGVKDEDWIPKAGKEHAVAITRDLKIQTTRHQKKLCEEYGLGVFFFSGASSGLSYWQIVKTLVEKWESILKIIDSQKPPFSFRFSVRSSKIERIDE